MCKKAKRQRPSLRVCEMRRPTTKYTATIKTPFSPLTLRTQVSVVRFIYRCHRTTHSRWSYFNSIQPKRPPDSILQIAILFVWNIEIRKSLRNSIVKASHVLPSPPPEIQQFLGLKIHEFENLAGRYRQSQDRDISEAPSESVVFIQSRIIGLSFANNSRNHDSHTVIC